MINKLKSLYSNHHKNTANLDKLVQFKAYDNINFLKNQPNYQDSKSLAPFGYKVYSQNEEDGIIHEIFTRIGTTNKVFVEFGIGDGLENNTLALLFNEWSGLWIEGSKKSVRSIKKNLNHIIEDGCLTIINAFITKNNINDLISSTINENNIDLLSIDIDGNDFHIFNAINCIKPRVLAIEYNAKFRPPGVYCMNYDKSHVWNGDDNFGSSLKFLEIELTKKGYCLVGCDLTGVNAFFVRQDLVGDKFKTPFTAETHYEPARYYLSGLPSGHTPSYKTLNNSIQKLNSK